MKIEGVFSLADYFNYYFAGLWWLACISIVLIPGSNLGQFVSDNSWLNENLALLLIGAFLIIIPYFVGFIMSPIAEFFTQKILIRLLGDPKKAVVYNDKDLNIFGLKLWSKQHLSASVLEKALQEINKRFCVKLDKGSSNLDTWHEVFFAYVSEYGNSSGSRAQRLRGLVSLTEGVLIPLPLFLLLLASRQALLPNWIVTFSGIVAFVLLIVRYFVLRKYLTMHLYRAMLILASDKKENAKPTVKG